MKVLVLGCKDYPAFTTPSVHSGGMEVYAERMIRSLSDRARFTLLTVGGVSDAAATVVPLGAANGLRSQPLTLMMRSWNHLRSARPQADLLNPQTPLAGLVARMAKRRFNIPYVVTVHIFGSDPAHAGGKLNALAYSYVERLVFSDATSIIPTGRRLGAALEERYQAISSKICVVTAAAEGVKQTGPRNVTRRRFGIAPEASLILFLGRLVEENGIEDLMTAFARVHDTRASACLVIAGTGDREEHVHSRIRSLGMGGVDGAIRMIGAVRGQEKLDLLAASDLMVRTSTHEVFPEAYLEALSVGTPVAATPVGDTPYLAEDSRAIALLPPGDPVGQAALIGALLDDPARRERMRAAALDYSARFRWDTQKERYWNVLASAAGAGA